MNSQTAFWFFCYYLFPALFAFTFYFALCWTPDGRRRWWKWFSRRRTPLVGWCRLETPGRVIYHCVNSPHDDAVKRLFFEAATESEKVKKKIIKVLARGMKDRIIPPTVDSWKGLAESATCYLIYRREPFMAGGWAQTKHGNTSDLILGMEKLFCKLYQLTDSAVGHELVHTAQEVREFALRAEWQNRPFLKAVWRFLRIEGEAHLHFWLWPLMLVFVLGLVFLAGLALYNDLWHFPSV